MGRVGVQNSKDYVDQSLDEIKLLRYINESDPADEHGVLRLYDYFYYRVNIHILDIDTKLKWSRRMSLTVPSMICTTPHTFFVFVDIAQKSV